MIPGLWTASDTPCTLKSFALLLTLGAFHALDDADVGEEVEQGGLSPFSVLSPLRVFLYLERLFWNQIFTCV